MLQYRNTKYFGSSYFFHVRSYRILFMLPRGVQKVTQILFVYVNKYTHRSLVTFTAHTHTGVSSYYTTTSTTNKPISPIEKIIRNFFLISIFFIALASRYSAEKFSGSLCGVFFFNYFFKNAFLFILTRGSSSGACDVPINPGNYAELYFS